MITHFREAQNDLSSLPVASDLYHQTHQANHVDMIADLVAQRLLDNMTPMLNPAPPPHLAVVPAPAPAPTLVAAAATNNTDLASLQQQIQQLVTIMTATTAGASSPAPLATRFNDQPARNYGRGSGYGRGNGRVSVRGREGRGQTAPSPRMYCWTHSACAHSSTDCNNKLPGHQVTATFSNMQGGSTNQCFWLPSST